MARSAESRRARARVLDVLSWAVLIGLALAAAGGVVMTSPPLRLGDRASRPDACGSCHNMEPELRAIRTARGHSSLYSCNDCHAPNDTPGNQQAWSSLFRARDYALYNLGGASYDSQALGISRDVIEANCVRCHGEMVSRVDVTTRRCWDCHRIMYHRMQLSRSTTRVAEGGLR